MPRFAANLSMMFQEWPFHDRFAAAADAGFTAVECQFPYAMPADEVASALARHRQRLVMFNVYAGDWNTGERGYAALPARREDLRASVRQAIEYARITGTDRLHLMAGIADRSDPAARQAYEESLQEAGERFAAAGLTLLIEPINRRDVPGYFLDDFLHAERLIAAAGISNLRLQFDIYHRQILHGDVATALRRLMPIIGHVQVASVPQRAEPGSGELRDAYLFDLLDELGYDGHVGAEYRPEAGTLAGLGWRANPR
jgi:2-dehydrotetronate isomerase